VFKINLINSKSQIIVLHCVNRENEICIDRVQFFETHREFLEDDKEAYKGPDFQTLNKKLQEEFIGFINTELEVKSEIAKFIRYLGGNREHRDFIKWMFNCMNFLIK
jgi:hypothetical protein